MCSYRYLKVWNNEHKGRNKEAKKYTNINKQVNKTGKLGRKATEGEKTRDKDKDGRDGREHVDSLILRRTAHSVEKL